VLENKIYYCEKSSLQDLDNLSTTWIT